MNKLISCVISCYNEEKNLPILLDQIISNKLNDKFQFIIVNNGSNDNSSLVIKELENKYKDIKFVNVKEDFGWGNGIMTGLKHAECELVGWTHGDLQYDLKELNNVYKIIQENDKKYNTILVKGLRKKRKLIENIFSKGMSVVASLILLKTFTDINSQPNFFSRDIYESFANPPTDLMLDLYLYNKVKKIDNHLIVRFPVIQHERKFGISSWRKNFLSNFELSLKQFIGILKIRFTK
tara:strand:- start:343 stop:1053 length:711 start_codon:yes stop_codon:yes gene_type:complete